MTTSAIASGATQVQNALPPDRLSEPPAARLKEEQDRRTGGAPEPVTEPQEIPSQVYDSRGRVVAAPSITGFDGTA